MKKKLIPIIFSSFLFLFGLSQGLCAEPVKIAAIFATTGIAADGNASSLLGVNLAISEINKSGGVLGKKLKIIIFDNKSTAIGSKIAAKKAVEENVTAIIGASWSTHSLAIAPIAQKYHIPMISNESTHPGVTKIGNYIFRVCYIDTFQGRALAKFASQFLKAATCAMIVNVSSDYSIELSKVFQTKFESLNGKVLIKQNYLSKRKNFLELLKPVKELSPDIIFIPGQNESAFIAIQAQDMGIKAIPIGGDSWGGTFFLQRGGEKLNIGYFSTHWTSTLTTKKSQDFIKKHGDKHSINVATVLAYDAVNVLVDAIKRANCFDKEKIQTALAKINNFQGVAGNISFDNNGDPIKNVIIMELKQGRKNYLKTISPN